MDIKNPHSEEEQLLEPTVALQKYLEAKERVKETKQKLVDELLKIVKEVSS